MHRTYDDRISNTKSEINKRHEDIEQKAKQDFFEQIKALKAENSEKLSKLESEIRALQDNAN